MKTIKEQRRIVKQVLEDYNFFLNAYSYLNSQLIINEDDNVYLIVLYGLKDLKKFYDFIVHIDISNDRNIVEVFRDDINVRKRLRDAGISWKQFGDYYYAPKLAIDSIIDFKKVFDLHQKILTDDSDYEQLIIEPDATPAELAALSIVEHTDIGRAIALHPNTPPNILIKLFYNFPAEVFAHPSFNDLLLTEPNFLEKLYNSCPGVFHKKDLNIPSVFIEWAINHEEEQIRANIAGTHDISARYLEKLADDKSCTVIAYLVARTCYPSSDPETHFSPNIMEKVWRRYMEFTESCAGKDRCCECEDILATV